MKTPRRYRIEFFEKGQSQTEMPDFIDVVAESRRDAMKIFWIEVGMVVKTPREKLVIVGCKEYNRPAHQNP